VTDTQARLDAIRTAPLTDNERRLAVAAWERADEWAAAPSRRTSGARQWGHLVLAAYDGRVAELERVTAKVGQYEALIGEADDELERVTAALREAAETASYLLDMIPRQVWLDGGGDDGQGHYEGDYRAARFAEDVVRDWLALAGAARAAQEGCAACQGDPEAHDLHVCGKEPFS
jgi:hypothetical protein